MRIRCLSVSCAVLALAALTAHAAERVTLRNGYDLVCDHRAADGNKVRLFLDSGDANFIEVDPSDIASTQAFQPPAPQTPLQSPTQTPTQTPIQTKTATLRQQDLRQLLARAGSEHDLDVDLLASVVRAESGGNPHAVSRTGARGLMQLMPGTAARLGVRDSFAADQNIGGGAAYLDAMLKRYHDNLALALAAYNAGPAAVDRWHGVPPYRETRTYVARVIHEFNKRYAARQRAGTAATQIASTR
ncbi:lytic transglycosylase domain-containing protein [Acidipila rosea]|uniref:Transglycosylase-like protein with SLT domain n=1 Tax=Acidipila rosea TaxID=768535 RepID=A0A4R1L9Q8_9BACT|nr:lytic transglycosylase domain-containing protein [Acidipila rosea]TCK75106.1 transglycosylase-like protein with SLT domain [Acidipila rosea]